MAETIVEKDSFIIPSGNSSKEVSFTSTTLKIDVNDNKDHKVATTYSHPKANYVKGKPDEEYIFDKNYTQNNPIYCNTGTYSGCIGNCVSCTTCVSACNANCFDRCVDCNTCQTCNSCQTECQTHGYGYIGNKDTNGREVYKVVASSECYNNTSISTRYDHYYKCAKPCMQCNTSTHSCSTCYTGTYINGGK